MYLFRFVFVSAVMLTAGCAAIPSDRGYGNVESLVAERQGQAPATLQEFDSARIDALVLQLLSSPLRPRDAVEVAQLKNPRLRAGYAKLGIAQAELYDAARLSNPTLSLTWLDSNENGAADLITTSLTQDFLNLLMLGPRKRVSEREVQRAELSLAADILQLRRDVEEAWFEHVGALQVSQMRALVAKATDVSARLAQRFFDAGNINRLELQLEQAAASQARLEADQAAAEAEVARVVLNTLMGLTDDEGRWRVAAALPLPVEDEDTLAALQTLARNNRLELAAARHAVAQREDLLSLTRRYRYIGTIEAGVEYERETDGSRLLGPTLSLQLPIFNQGSSAVLSAEARLEIAQAGLRELEIEISNEVALASRKVGVARQLLATYQQRLLPQREEIVKSSQEMQSFMIIGQFELFRAKREQYDSYQGYIEALRDYWLARTHLAAAIGGTLPSAAQVGEPTLDVKTLTTPQGTGHAGHGKSMGHPDHAPPASDTQHKKPHQHMNHHGETP